jgi:hypothetical protein
VKPFVIVLAAAMVIAYGAVATVAHPGTCHVDSPFDMPLKCRLGINAYGLPVKCATDEVWVWKTEWVYRQCVMACPAVGCT